MLCYFFLFKSANSLFIYFCCLILIKKSKRVNIFIIHKGRASMIMRTVSGFNSSAPTLYRPPNGPSQFVSSPLPSLSHSQSSPSSAQKDAAVNNSISTTQVDDSSSQFSNTNDQVMMTPTSIAPTSPSDVSLVNNDTPSSSSPSPTRPHKPRDSPSTPKTPKSSTRLGDEFIA